VPEVNGSKKKGKAQRKAQHSSKGIQKPEVPLIEAQEAEPKDHQVGASAESKVYAKMLEAQEVKWDDEVESRVESKVSAAMSPIEAPYLEATKVELNLDDEEDNFAKIVFELDSQSGLDVDDDDEDEKEDTLASSDDDREEKNEICEPVAALVSTVYRAKMMIVGFANVGRLCALH
jgi:hypothetical protein